MSPVGAACLEAEATLSLVVVVLVTGAGIVTLAFGTDFVLATTGGALGFVARRPIGDGAAEPSLPFKTVLVIESFRAVPLTTDASAFFMIRSAFSMTGGFLTIILLPPPPEITPRPLLVLRAVAWLLPFGALLRFSGPLAILFS